MNGFPVPTRCEIFARPSTNFDAATPVNVAQMPALGGSGGTTREIAGASVVLSPAPDRKNLKFLFEWIAGIGRHKRGSKAPHRIQAFFRHFHEVIFPAEGM
jgi:hypothetical protein